MNFQKHIANAINNTAKTRERESNSALNLSSSKKANCRTKRSEVSQKSKNTNRDISLNAQYDKNSVIASEQRERGNPHTANCHTEGVARSISKITNTNRDISRSRAQYDKEDFVIINNDKENSVIASEQSERGNLRGNTKTIDCHANAVAFSRNDSNICHTERSEVSQKNIDCHDSTLRAESRNDGVISPSLAEGARGWVSLEVSKSPASLKSQNLQSKEKTDFSVASLANAKSNNANFASAKSTHPLTPSC